jgi:uncharacterized protein (TIGR00369 family)
VVLSAPELADFLRHWFPGSTDTFLVEEVTATGVAIRLPVHAGHGRPGGTVSGPTMMALADTVAWLATLSRLGPEALAVTSNLTIDFLRKPPLDADLWGVGELVRMGRRQSVCEVRILSGAHGELVARATVTYAIPVPPATR